MTNLEKEKRNRERGIHWRSYTYSKPGGHDGRQEYIVLIGPQSQNFDRVLHEVGLKLISSNPPRYGEGLEQASLMEAFTQEMLTPYDVFMLRPTRESVKLDNKPPVIGALEAESCRSKTYGQHSSGRRNAPPAFSRPKAP